MLYYIEETVPCQFCGKQCSFSQLEDHQMTCRFTLGNTNAFDLVEPDSQAAAVTVSCNMCHREFLKKDIHSHKVHCTCSRCCSMGGRGREFA